MNRKRSFATFALSAALAWVPASAAAPRGGQSIDPFYLKALKDGESFFQAKHYKEASDNLEIAAFGLFAKKDALARTRVFLALCYANLNDRARTEQNLKSAQQLLGTEGLRGYDLPEPARSDLAKVLRVFKIEASPLPRPADENPPAVPPVLSVVPLSSKPPSGLPSETALKDAIRQEPRQADSYYALARLHSEAKDPAAAKTTLNRLLENNPAEIRAYLELGRIAYGERSLKEAEKYLEKFLNLKDSVSVERLRIVEAKALLALSAYLRGDTKKALAALADAPELTDPALRDGLALGADDRERLAQLLQRLAK